MNIEIALLISVISVCFSVYFGLKNNKRTDTKDIEERVKDNTRINVKLDDIGQDTKEIKSEISSMREDIKIEESCKQAHRRLNGLEERLNGKEVRKDG